LETAQENSRLNGLDIRFEQMDMLNPETYTSFPEYDVVVSNPPYVTESDKAQMKANVLEHEPHSALFVADDRALLFYEAILDFCHTHLAVNGRVYFEINESKGKEMVSLLAKRGYGNISLHKDIHGKERFVSAVKGKLT
jgi:release factor glutamine methyltransferase